MTFSSPEDIPLSTEPEIVAFATETMGHIYSSRKMEHNI
jgi:hypothetical protein